jgi:hypothetical protein
MPGSQDRPLIDALRLCRLRQQIAHQNAGQAVAVQRKRYFVGGQVVAATEIVGAFGRTGRTGAFLEQIL